MDKGIRNGVIIQFNAMVPQLATLGGKAFRKEVREWTIENYGCTGAAASTHYAFAFNEAKKHIPEQLAGLGRAEGKNNGGRKRKDAPVIIWEGIKPNTSTHTVTVNELTAVELVAAPEQTEFTVKKKSDGSVVAEGLSFDDARALVNKAALAKKAKLYWI